jgi:hypothetical protein
MRTVVIVASALIAISASASVAPVHAEDNGLTLPECGSDRAEYDVKYVFERNNNVEVLELYDTVLVSATASKVSCRGKVDLSNGRTISISFDFEFNHKHNDVIVSFKPIAVLKQQ